MLISMLLLLSVTILLPIGKTIQFARKFSIRFTHTPLPYMLEVEKGDNVTLNCETEGYPRPTNITWVNGHQPCGELCLNHSKAEGYVLEFQNIVHLEGIFECHLYRYETFLVTHVFNVFMKQNETIDGNFSETQLEQKKHGTIIANFSSTEVPNPYNNSSEQNETIYGNFSDTELEQKKHGTINANFSSTELPNHYNNSSITYFLLVVILFCTIILIGCCATIVVYVCRSRRIKAPTTNPIDIDVSTPLNERNTLTTTSHPPTYPPLANQNPAYQPVEYRPVEYCQTTTYESSSERLRKLIGMELLKVVDTLPVKKLNECLKIEEKLLGEGNFSTVQKGKLLLDNGNEQYVAVKTLKGITFSSVLNDFMEEVKIMQDLRHENIVTLIGVSLKGDSTIPSIITEYMSRGSLGELLRNDHQLLPETLLSFSKQISEGMNYLSSNKLVHRDLATRNILVGYNLVVKICDFGLCRSVQLKDYYKIFGKPSLPVRWISPESLESGIFTLQSDVWAYGIVLGEIFSRGEKPYPQIEKDDDVPKYVRETRRIEIPDYCPDIIVQIISQCMRDAERRPKFSDICLMLDAASTPSGSE